MDKRIEKLKDNFKNLENMDITEYNGGLMITGTRDGKEVMCCIPNNWNKINNKGDNENEK